MCLLRLIVLPRRSAWPSSPSARMICCCCWVHFFSISEAAREPGSLIAVRKQQTVACWQSGIIRFPIQQHRDDKVGRILIFTPSRHVNWRQDAETQRRSQRRCWIYTGINLNKNSRRKLEPICNQLKAMWGNAGFIICLFRAKKKFYFCVTFFFFLLTHCKSVFKKGHKNE